jgi:small basic protein (TIGR04137 family)
MSLDKSLRSHGALERHRNVLSRAERVEALQDEEAWEEGRSVFGLPKVAHRKVATKRHKPAKAEAAEAAEGEAAPAPAEAAEAPQARKADSAG